MSVTTASGKGGARLGMAEWGDDDLIADVEHPTPPASLFVNDWFWGGCGPPDATLIPWTWLAIPLELRQDQPINSAQITAGNTTAQANDITSQARYGTFSASGSTSAALVADAQNYADFLIAYYANPLLRCPTWTLDLVPRLADEEKWRILGREIGDRVTLAPSTLVDPNGHSVTLPVPAGLPAASRSIVIEGIAHDSAATSRLVTWTTSPLIGPTVGVEGPWFRTGSSSLNDPTTPLPF